jgi:hypothetical protein
MSELGSKINHVYIDKAGDMPCPNCGQSYLHIEEVIVIPAGTENIFGAAKKVSGYGGKVTKHLDPHQIPPIPWGPREEERPRFILVGYCDTGGCAVAIGFSNYKGDTRTYTVTW